MTSKIGRGEVKLREGSRDTDHTGGPVWQYVLLMAQSQTSACDVAEDRCTRGIASFGTAPWPVLLEDQNSQRGCPLLLSKHVEQVSRGFVSSCRDSSEPTECDVSLPAKRHTALASNYGGRPSPILTFTSIRLPLPCRNRAIFLCE